MGQTLHLGQFILEIWRFKKDNPLSGGGGTCKNYGVLF